MQISWEVILLPHVYFAFSIMFFVMFLTTDLDILLTDGVEQ